MNGSRFADEPGRLLVKIYKRLVEIKRKYDPDNILHLNQNIKPGRPSV